MYKIGIEIKSEFMKTAIANSIKPIFPRSWAVILESEKVSMDGILTQICYTVANNSIQYLESMNARSHTQQKA